MSDRHHLAGPLPGIEFVIDERGADGALPIVWLHGALGDLGGLPLGDVPGARWLTLHQLGFGVATGVEQFDRIDELALAYWWALDRLGLDSIVLVGHCFGGTVAAEMATQQPQRVQGLALLAPFGMFDVDDPGVDLFGTTPRDLLPAMYSDPDGELAAAHHPVPVDAHERGLQTIARVQVLSAAGRFLFPIPDTGIAARAYRLAGLDVKVLLGADDRLVPPSLASAWSAAIPEADVTVLDGAAHMLPYERADEATDAVAELCARALAAS